jgi:hypothetical protein
MDAIRQLYEESLPARRQCVEQITQVTASVAELVLDGAVEKLLQQTQELARASAEHLAVRQRLHDEVISILTPLQRQKLDRLPGSRVVE